MRILLDPEAPTEGKTTTTPPPPAPPATDPAEGYRAALKKHDGDAAAMARAVYADNEALRKQLAEAQAKVPAAGSFVLTAEQGEAWKRYKALGKPDDLETRLEAGRVAAEKIEAAERKNGRDAVAKLYGIEPEVLAELKGVDELKFEVNKLTRNGKTVEVGQVVEVVDGEPKRLDFDRFAAERWPNLMGALKPARRDQTSPTRASAPVDLASQRPNGSGNGPVYDEVLAGLAGMF